MILDLKGDMNGSHTSSTYLNIKTTTTSNASFLNNSILYGILAACNQTANDSSKCMEQLSSNQTLSNPVTLNKIVYFPTTFLIGFHIAYAILLLVGILGNVLTCYVIVRRKNMRRAIHLYTFNLAVADLLILFVYVPNQMLVMEEQFKWLLGRVICKINYVILPVALHASVGTLLAITIDR